GGLTDSNGQLRVNITNSAADGKAKNSVLVTVTDNRNNPIAGAPVTIKVPGNCRLSDSACRWSDRQ
ncbi:Ig-like domain-containing protein, partial [Escherichia coli]|uniref:Ig-like domain-containing protein n=1 Tax=Escherichia coli TaxID=562 RepID=UPI001596CF13